MGTQGHPRHQLREFTVTVRKTGSRAGKLHVTAQTERDAILRAGLALARRHPGTDASLWHVTGTEDPAPFAWSPPALAPGEAERISRTGHSDASYAARHMYDPRPASSQEH